MSIPVEQFHDSSSSQPSETLRDTGATASSRLDPAFLSLPLQQLADAALDRGRQLGAEHVAFRCDRIRRAEVRTRDARPDGSEDSSETALSVRVVFNGTWGFASTVELTVAETVRITELAVEAAQLSAPISEHVRLANEPVYENALWVSSYTQNPFEICEAARFSVLEDWSRRLLAASPVEHVYAKIRIAQENKFYADSANTVTTQQRVRIYPQLTVVAASGAGNSFETMRTLGPPAGRGWEYVSGVGWDWESELAQLPSLLAEKMQAPPVAPGAYDLVIDASNLWLTIHETVGHATELDRVLGYEAAYAGTSFAAFDHLGVMRYGSKLMNVTGDRTIEHGLATIGYDDEGVAAQRWDLIRGGVLVGYQLDRHMASLKELGRSNGCAFAQSGADVPVQRMPNVSLLPAPAGPSIEELLSDIRTGIYIVGDKSWSIDMQRNNFQFTGQRCFKIQRGRLVGQLRNLAYEGTTTNFWNSMVAVGGESTYGLYGADYCGKAQPIQIAAASHGSPAALFSGVRVINTSPEGCR